MDLKVSQVSFRKDHIALVPSNDYLAQCRVFKRFQPNQSAPEYVWIPILSKLFHLLGTTQVTFKSVVVEAILSSVGHVRALH